MNKIALTVLDLAVIISLVVTICALGSFDPNHVPTNPMGEAKAQMAVAVILFAGAIRYLCFMYNEK